ncbi:MAG: fibronectin type III domain-containing protein [Minisyncoccota bacterium]
MTLTTKKQENVLSRIMLATAVAGVIGAIGISALAHAQSTDRTPLSTQLGVGSTGSDVQRLQTFLAMDATVYPQGIVSGFYGPLTRNAVAQFQIGYGLPPVGNVGPLTLQKINGLLAAGTPPDVDAPFVGSVKVTPASTSAVITWTTNESALGKVHYDTAPITILETSTAKTEPITNGTMVAEQNYTGTHSITLSGLTPNTLYYYSLESVDIAGNVSVSLPAVFTTTQ